MQGLNTRGRKILQMLAENPHLSVNEISSCLEVSSVTIRSDFDDLSEKGYLIRTRGGAMPAFHPDILSRQKASAKKKEAIAKLAASLVLDGETIMIEAGTTTALVAKYLLGKRGVKVVSDSTLILPYARSNPALQLTLVGGTFRAEVESMVGPATVAHLEQFYVKTAFIGTDGFSRENGLTTHIMEATEVVRTMHQRSDRTVLLADSSKWGQAGFARIIPLKDIDTLVIDADFAESERQIIHKMGIELLIAEI